MIVAGRDMSDGFWQAPIDFFSLVLILISGLELGLIGFFGFSPLAWLLGSWRPLAYDAVGVAALWQISRQRLRG
jgi:uncharacterized membrane protein YuzA (DUF378 family)